MKKSYRASNFLDTLDKYAKRQKSKTAEDMKKQEELELQKVEQEIIEDANAMIEKEIISMKNKISIEVSRKENEERKKVSRRRKEIMKDMFRECRKRLIEFAKSSKYENSLKVSTKKISEVLKNGDTILSIRKEDSQYEKIIKEAFGSSCEINFVNDISIGGIRGYSSSMGLIADETLDAKLKEQEDWAAEKFGVLLV